VNGAEILEVLHQLPVVNQFLTSLYNCHYADFFVALGKTALLFLIPSIKIKLNPWGRCLVNLKGATSEPGQ